MVLLGIEVFFKVMYEMQREQTEAQGPEQAFQTDQSGREVIQDSSQMASVHEAIPDSNRGFQMLQRMGWKGQGLGSKEEGAHSLRF